MTPKAHSPTSSSSPAVAPCRLWIKPGPACSPAPPATGHCGLAGSHLPARAAPCCHYVPPTGLILDRLTSETRPVSLPEASLSSGQLPFPQAPRPSQPRHTERHRLSFRPPRELPNWPGFHRRGSQPGAGRGVRSCASVDLRGRAPGASPEVGRTGRPSQRPPGPGQPGCACGWHHVLLMSTAGTCAHSLSSALGASTSPTFINSPHAPDPPLPSAHKT